MNSWFVMNNILTYSSNHKLGSLIVLGILIALPIRVWIPLPLFNSISLLDIVNVCLLIYIIIYLAQKQRINIGDRWVFVALAAPLVILLISLLWTTDAGSTVKQIIIYSEAFICYLATITLIKKGSRRYRDAVIVLIMAFVSTMLLCSLLSLLHVPGFAPRLPPELEGDPNQLTNYFNSYYSRLSNPFIGLSNDFGSILLLFVFPLYAIASYKRTFFARTIAHLNLLAIFMTQSRGVLIALVTCWLIYFSRHWGNKRFWRVFAAILATLVIGLTIYLNINSDSAQFLSTRFNLSNVGVRFAGYGKVMQLILRRPLLGYGGGVIPTDNPIVAIGIHNAYLEQILFYGILGGMFAILFILLIPLRFWIIYKNNIGETQIFTGAVALSIFAESIVYLSETSYQASVLRVLIYFSLALLIMLTRIGASHPENMKN